MLTHSPSRGPDGMGRNKHGQTPWARGGWERQRNMKEEAHPGLELWQVKTQNRTEPRSLL